MKEKTWPPLPVYCEKDTKMAPNWRKFVHCKPFAAELLGTFVLVVVSKGSAMSMAYEMLSEGQTPAGNHLPSALSGGLAVMMAIIITGKASGGHTNPAVSVTMTAAGRLSPYQLPAYLAGQLLGAALGSVVVLAAYTDSLGVVSPAHISSAPDLAHSHHTLVLDQIVASYLLLLCIISVGEQDHSPGGLLVGLSVCGIGLAFGRNAGAAINPALDTVPRLVALLWHAGGTVRGGKFWLIPFTAPYAGGLLALLTYRYVIGLKAKDQVEPDGATKAISGEQVKMLGAP